MNNKNGNDDIGQVKRS